MAENQNNEQTIFRKKALEQLSSPDQLDQLIQVVSPQAWVGLLAVGIIILTLIGWLIFGTITTRADGSGILLAGGGEVYQAAAPDGPSRIEKILVKPGDMIQKGQVIATLSRPDLTNEITVSQNAIQDLSQKYAQLSTLYEQQLTIRKADIAQQREAMEKDLTNNKIKLKNAGDLLAVKQIAYKQGLQTRQDIDASVQAFYNIKNDIAKYSDQLAQLQIAENNFEDEWRERLRELELKIADEKTHLANLVAKRQLSNSVISPIAGQVINVQVSTGTIVKTGDAVINIANAGVGMDALILLPPRTGKRIKPGMKALVTPNTVEKAEYGSIYGKVIAVSAFPAPSAAIASVLQNPDLVKQLSGKETPIEVRIKLQADPKTYSGLKWTSSRGPKQMITPGTLATGLITIREQAPATLIIPMFKKITGTE
jgi:HlyD family secretion protein